VCTGEEMSFTQEKETRGDLTVGDVDHKVLIGPLELGVSTLGDVAVGKGVTIGAALFR